MKKVAVFFSFRVILNNLVVNCLPRARFGCPSLKEQSARGALFLSLGRWGRGTDELGVTAVG